MLLKHVSGNAKTAVTLTTTAVTTVTVTVNRCRRRTDSPSPSELYRLYNTHKTSHTKQQQATHTNSPCLASPPQPKQQRGRHNRGTKQKQHREQGNKKTQTTSNQTELRGTAETTLDNSDLGNSDLATYVGRAVKSALVKSAKRPSTLPVLCYTSSLKLAPLDLYISPIYFPLTCTLT